jgi:predicted metal-dependent peptidase
VAIDTSGSIGQREINTFFGELTGILDDVRPSKVYVMWCDARVHKVDEVDDSSDVNTLKPRGGGGTSFIPVFEEIEKLDIYPEALVYLTDGMGSFPQHAPNYPVLWGDIYNRAAQYPFGEVVDVKLS